MKPILTLSLLLAALTVSAADADPKELKALSAARGLYSMNINAEKNAARFALTKKSCGGEDGTQVCVYIIGVKEKDPTAGVTSYSATFMNSQLTKIEQSCNYCW